MCVQQESAASLMILSIRYLDSTTQRFSLYHFTTGSHVDDPRLTTLPPYGLDH